MTVLVLGVAFVVFLCIVLGDNFVVIVEVALDVVMAVPHAGIQHRHRYSVAGNPRVVETISADKPDMLRIGNRASSSFQSRILVYAQGLISFEERILF